MYFSGGFIKGAIIMAVKRLQWNNLLHLTELKFEPEEPKQLTVSDELVMSISWLTAATKHDRKLLRCDENGALLIADAWSLLTVVLAAELAPTTGTPHLSGPLAENKGVLIATSTEIVTLSFQRILDGVWENFYIPPATLYWYPKPTYQVKATVVPAETGTASIVGITTLK